MIFSEPPEMGCGLRQVTETEARCLPNDIATPGQNSLSDFCVGAHIMGE